jgi:hypothetical protein
MTRGCNDCAVGPAVSLFEAIRDDAVQLRFDSPTMPFPPWILALFGTLRQSRRFLIPAALL